MAQAQNLVNAPAGRRLGAALLDMVPVAIVTAVSLSMTATAMTALLSGSAADAASMSLPAAALVVPQLLLLAYLVFIWGWEAKAGKTPGNVLLGIRTTNEDGFAPGWGRVLLRRLIVSVAGIVPLIGPVLVLLSNLWDANAQRQGWHDKVAKTLMVDVRTGRNPITTGGLFGPAAFAPRAQSPSVGQQAGSSVSRPMPQQPMPQPAPPSQRDAEQELPFDAQGYPRAPRPAAGSTAPGPLPEPGAPITAVPGAPGALGAAAAPGAPAPAQAPPPPPAAAGHAPGFTPASAAAWTPEPEPAPEHAAAPEYAAEYAAEPAPEYAVLTFDDGQTARLGGTLLIGRNPAPAPDEGDVELFNVADLGRSVSKTHLSVRLEAGRLWVTDRHSTNGSGITGADGGYQPLVPGVPAPVRSGDIVHFGDRRFEVTYP